MQWFWNFHLEEPEGNKWDEVERRRTLFKRERSKSVVFTAKEPEKISNDYCADVDGDDDEKKVSAGQVFTVTSRAHGTLFLLSVRLTAPQKCLYIRNVIGWIHYINTSPELLQVKLGPK